MPAYRAIRAPEAGSCARSAKCARACTAGWVLAVTLLATGIQGCTADRRSAWKADDRSLNALQVLYVVKSASDERGVNDLLVDRLRRLGFVATTGPADTRPAPVDAIVTYEASWRWDVTLYLLELKVWVREPGTDVLVALGISTHGSLTRRQPDGMVAEALGSIFGQSRGKSPEPK
jgi:hypothetical protein